MTREEFNNWRKIHNITYHTCRGPIGLKLIYLYKEKEYTLDQLSVLYSKLNLKSEVKTIQKTLKHKGFIRFNFKKWYKNGKLLIFNYNLYQIWNSLMFKLYKYYTKK